MIRKLSKLSRRAKTQMALVAKTAVLCCGLISTAHALSFDQISQVYFFGDSLTDSGFNDRWYLTGLTTPGKAPTFTTYGGYTWAQYVARDIKNFVLPIYPPVLPPDPSPPDTITNNTTPLNGSSPLVSGLLTGVDYAAGGSTTNSTGVGEAWAPSLHMQIQHFLATKTFDANTVFFIWSGANDILAVLLSGPMPTQLQFLQAANTAAMNIANEVAALSLRGAKRFVILSLPNIGYTPLIMQIAAANHLPTLPAQIKTVSFTFNSFLNQQLGKVIAKYGIKVLYVDVYTLLDNVILATKAGQPFVVAGQSFEFVNYNQPACPTADPDSINCPSGAPNNYIFADTLHPTNMAHRLLSLMVEEEILKWK